MADVSEVTSSWAKASEITLTFREPIASSLARPMTVEDVDALQALKNATQALACDPELQLSLLPDFVDKPFELIDEFDNWSRATLWREGLVITSEQELAVRRVQQAIEAMTEHDLAEEAVRTAETWSELRALASEVLRSFGWPREAPANWSSVYVKASPP